MAKAVNRGFSLRVSGFDHRQVRVKFVADKMTLRRVCLPVLGISPAMIPPRSLLVLNSFSTDARDSTVGIATGYGLNGSRIASR
jgi:hypothetical protein